MKTRAGHAVADYVVSCGYALIFPNPHDFYAVLCAYTSTLILHQKSLTLPKKGLKMDQEGLKLVFSDQKYLFWGDFFYRNVRPIVIEGLP